MVELFGLCQNGLRIPPIDNGSVQYIVFLHLFSINNLHGHLNGNSTSGRVLERGFQLLISYGLQSGTVTIYPVDTYKPDTFAGHGITLHDDVPGSKRHHVVVGIDQIDVGKSS